MRKNFIALVSAFILLMTFAVAGHAQTDNNSNDNQTSDKKLKILKKPIPQSSGCKQVEGVVVVRVTFDKSAKVTSAVINQSSGCASFDKSSVESARRIEFEPQTENGEPVTVDKTVEYRFYRY